MKKSIIAIFGCALIFAACKEIGPQINLTAGTISADTSYTVSPVPAADPHNVLIELFSGQSCNNCPVYDQQLTTYTPASQLNVIALYVYASTPQTQQPSGSPVDVRDSFANDLEAIYGDPTGFGLPCAGIDRVPIGGSLLQPHSTWSDAFNQRISIVDSLNDSVTSSFSLSDSIATITVWTTYLQNVTTQQNLSIAIVEDSIVGYQEDGTHLDTFYVFNNVLRSLVTSEPYGDPILPTMSSKPAGLVNRRIYSYKVKSGWKLAHCRVIAFVTYSNSEPTRDVFQSEQCKLMGP